MNIVLARPPWWERLSDWTLVVIPWVLAAFLAGWGYGWWQIAEERRQAHEWSVREAITREDMLSGALDLATGDKRRAHAARVEALRRMEDRRR